VSAASTSLAVTLAVALAAGAALDPGAAGAGSGQEDRAGANRPEPGQGKLIVRERRLESEITYTEGYVSFLRVRLAGSREAAVKRRFARRVRLRRKLPAGDYRVTRFIRPCDANCGFLDGRTERCSAPVEVAAGDRTKVVIRTKTGSDCEVRVKTRAGGGDSTLRCPLGAAQQLDADRLLGMRLAPAEALAERFDCTVRIVRLDGEWQIVTQDHRSDRINVWLDDGVVTKVESIG
jgi:hypothetical protein